MRAMVLIVVLGLLAGGASEARAQAQMEFIPSLSLFSVYDDNLFATNDSTAGRMLLLRPTFEGSYESPTLRMLGLYSFDMQRSNFSSLNTFDARRHALTDLRYRSTPMTTLTFTGRYDRSDTPGELNFDTGILGPRQTAERLQLVPGWSRRVGFRHVATASYDFTDERLVGGEDGTMHVARTGISRNVSTRTSVGLGYVGRFFVNEDDDHTSNGLLASWSRQMRPGTMLSFAAGPRYTTYRGWVPEVVAGFARTTPYLRTAIDYWHGETIVLGVEGPVAVDSATAGFNWPMSRSLEVGTFAGASHITALDGHEQTVYRGAVIGSWSPGGIYIISATYDLSYQIGDIQDRFSPEGVLLDDNVMRHVFRVGITVAPRWRRSILPPEEAARVKGVNR